MNRVGNKDANSEFSPTMIFGDDSDLAARSIESLGSNLKTLVTSKKVQPENLPLESLIATLSSWHNSLILSNNDSVIFQQRYIPIRRIVENLQLRNYRPSTASRIAATKDTSPKSDPSPSALTQ